jgi:hypothetical protein
VHPATQSLTLCCHTIAAAVPPPPQQLLSHSLSCSQEKFHPLPQVIFFCGHSRDTFKVKVLPRSFALGIRHYPFALD